MFITWSYNKKMSNMMLKTPVYVEFKFQMFPELQKIFIEQPKTKFLMKLVEKTNAEGKIRYQFEMDEWLPFGKISDISFKMVKADSADTQLAIDKDGHMQKAFDPDILFSKTVSRLEEKNKRDKVYDLMEKNKEDD